jgi:integrase
VRRIRQQIVGKPRTQKLFTQVASALFNFGIENDYCDTNPAARMKRTGRARSYRPWDDAACAAFEASAPPTPLLTAYMLARYTGQRQADVLAMTRAAYDGRGISLVQGKTAEPVWIKAHARLKSYLDARPKDSLLLVVREDGAAFVPNSFSKLFAAHLRHIGLVGLNFHGLRHTAARALAEVGCTENEIMAITGHRTSAMVALYTRAARQKRLASAAIGKLEEGDR